MTQHFQCMERPRKQFSLLWWPCEARRVRKCMEKNFHNYVRSSSLPVCVSGGALKAVFTTVEVLWSRAGQFVCKKGCRKYISPLWRSCEACSHQNVCTERSKEHFVKVLRSCSTAFSAFFTTMEAQVKLVQVLGIFTTMEVLWSSYMPVCKVAHWKQFSPLWRTCEALPGKFVYPAELKEFSAWL